MKHTSHSLRSALLRLFLAICLSTLGAVFAFAGPPGGGGGGWKISYQFSGTITDANGVHPCPPNMGYIGEAASGTAGTWAVGDCTVTITLQWTGAGSPPIGHSLLVTGESYAFGLTQPVTVSCYDSYGTYQPYADGSGLQAVSTGWHLYPIQLVNNTMTVGPLTAHASVYNGGGAVLSWGIVIGFLATVQ